MTSRGESSAGGAEAQANLDLIRRLNVEFDAVGAARVNEALREYSDPTVILSALGDLGRLIVRSFDPQLGIDLSAYPVTFAGAAQLQGVSGWIELWRAWLEPYDRFSFEVDDLEAIGDEVVHELRGWGRLRESGREVTWRQTRVCPMS